VEGKPMIRLLPQDFMIELNRAVRIRSGAQLMGCAQEVSKEIHDPAPGGLAKAMKANDRTNTLPGDRE
jgi:hypothetical protein